MIRRLLARAALGLLLLTVGGFGYLNLRLYRRVCRPPRFEGVAAAEVLLRAESAKFVATDGVKLAGNFLKGREGAPAIVLCHDRGADRSGVLRVAILLNNVGYSVLVFDFRGHGESGDGAVTLGIREREDVLGAIAYLRNRPDVPSGYGVWGIGMGAYAALLAAPEAEDVRAVGLAFLYADARDVVRREFEAVFRAPMGSLEGTYLGFFDRVAGSEAALYLPEKFVDEVASRQVLLVVAADDAEGRAYVEERIYPQLDPVRRTLIKVAHRVIPNEGQDRDGFEVNTIRFFKSALPLPESR